MRWGIAFGALVCFALINTAFLGYYVLGGSTIGGLNSSGQTVTFSTTTSTAESVSSSTVPASTYTVTETVTSTQSSNAVGGLANSTQTTISSTALSSTQSQPSSQTSSVTNSSNKFGAGAGSHSTPGASVLSSLVSFFEDHSLVLAPGSWFFVGGMWIWRGRMRSKWTDLGFDSDVFTLFVKMKGAKTRIRLLDALSVPKDRLQLADELGLDWKSVDRHVAIMKKYGFLDDKVAYGRVRLYQLTPVGTSLLKLLQELSKEERREGEFPQIAVEGEA